MTQSKDPVCGMMVDSAEAAGPSIVRGTTHYFCSAQCLWQFEANPSRYIGETAGVPAEPGASDASQDELHVDLERHEPRFTKWGGLVAPKFGAAGSGGLEYERLPEAHDDRHNDRQDDR